MSDACNVAMTRSKPRLRRATDWWAEALAELRRGAVQARRTFQRVRRRRRSSEADKIETHRLYRAARYGLVVSIAKEKARAWEKLLLSLSISIHVGVHTRLSLTSSSHGRLRLPTPSPRQCRRDPLPGRGWEGTCKPRVSETPWSEDLEVDERELAGVVKKLGSGRQAPGPDSIPGRAWVLAAHVFGGRLRHLFTQCLRRGCFFPAWRRAKLVLRKGGKPEGDPSAWRPICLLDEAGKLLEGVIAERLVQHLFRTGPDLHDD